MSTTNPKWWTPEHTTAWDRVKDAMKRDWEQTKSDFSTGGKDLRQNAADTVKQALGATPTPAPAEANSKPGMLLAEWHHHDEDDYRFGVGARYHYGDAYPVWTDDLEAKLVADWTTLENGRYWEDARTLVRRGYDRSHN